MKQHPKHIIAGLLVLVGLSLHAQHKTMFSKVGLDSLGVRIYQIFPTLEGGNIAISSIGIWLIKGRQMNGPGLVLDHPENLPFKDIRWRNFDGEDSIRAVAQSLDSLLYFVSRDNRFFFRPNGMSNGFGWAPFNFPKTSPVTSIWIDGDNNLYVGTRSDNFFVIPGAGDRKSYWGVQYKGDKDSNWIVTKGALPVRPVKFAPGTGVFTFAADQHDKNLVWIGTDNGLYQYNRNNGQCRSASPDNHFTVTAIGRANGDKLWFSTLENGMGAMDLNTRRTSFFPVLNPEKKSALAIHGFCTKNPNEFFVALADTLPCIFNTLNGRYMFFSDSTMHDRVNTTEDIDVDALGNLLLVRNGVLFIADASSSALLKTAVVPDSSLLAPYITSISLFSGEELAGMFNHPERLQKIELKHNQNTIIVQFGINDFTERKNMVFAYKIEGLNEHWIELARSNSDMSMFSLQDLPAGEHNLLLRARSVDGNWRKPITRLEITVLRPFWRTWWFWLLVISSISPAVYLVLQRRINTIRKEERKKTAHEKELLELEARALRAQMNPHFIYNCLNSMKGLIQTGDDEAAINYLTTFSKLIRTLFQHSDKRQISLHDELETCKMYTKLETMRLAGKLTYHFDIDPNVDLKSLMVPALIIQPFIENAIWHGIVPREDGGHVEVSVKGSDEVISCTVDDNGIGRERSRLNAPDPSLNHESKGVHLSQKRLDIQKLLTETGASIETFDKHEGNIATGTKVVITFNL